MHYRSPAELTAATINAKSDFADRLLAWHRQHGRHDLPWQNTRDPYRIWLSEIMLQQTQVSAVIPYYQRFLTRFPELAALAAADIDEVLALWAGLGYYARARNLHRCARTIVAEYGGYFPDNAAAIVNLPGIGRSTAAALAAFAFDERAAILDGNVKRVLTRVFGIAGFPGKSAVERKLWELAESLLPPAADIAAYTQGIMDLGATLCMRSRPDCSVCPMRGPCVAERDGRQAELPEAKPMRAIPERETQVVLFIDGKGRLLLESRPPTGIWGGLWSLPEGEAETLAHRFGVKLLTQESLPKLRHAFTHFRLTLQPLRCRVEVLSLNDESTRRWFAPEALATTGLPAPITKILARASATSVS